MARILDETRDHSGNTAFFGDDGDDSFAITVPSGELFDRVVLTIVQQTRGGANVTFNPSPGEGGTSRVEVHWWFNGGRTRGRIKYRIEAFTQTLAAGRAVRFLDYRAAKEAGATFHHNIEQSTGPYHRLGVGDWLDATWTGQWDDPKPGVVFQAYEAFGSVNGLKANPEAYKNFRLKNGWTIRSVTRQNWRTGRTGFRFHQSPVIGSDAPYMHAHVHTETDGLPTNDYIKVGIAIMIEGPRGRDPYFA
jgi:hypothetical protein